MTTTQQDKGGAKPRQRARKADQRAQRGEKQASPRRDQADQDSVAEIAAPMEPPPIEDNAPIEATDATLSGEVLPPEIRSHVAAQPLPGIGLHSIAAAYLDYARKSWAAGRMLVERFMTARSLDEAAEVQGDFARQSFANYLVHSQQVCGLYAGFTHQFFRPLESLTIEWTRVGR
jgi:Phasin protein